MPDFTDEQMEAAAKEYGLLNGKQTIASAAPAPSFSDEDMLKAAQEYNMVPAPKTKQFDLGASKGNDFLDGLGALGHGLAEGGYRVADLALAPMQGLSKAAYKTVTGNEPAENISTARDFNNLFAPPKNWQPVQKFGQSIAPGIAANFVAPGSGLVGLAVNGAVGNGLTTAGEQLSQTGQINPLQVAGDAALGAITNPIATRLTAPLLQGARTIANNTLGKIIPGAFKNTPQITPAISNPQPALQGSARLNVINPALLEGEDLAAHHLMNANISLPPANLQAPVKDAAAIAAAERLAKYHATKEQIRNFGRQMVGKPMGSFPVQVRHTLGEIGMMQTPTVAPPVHNYLDTSSLNPVPIGTYRVMHLGSVHELPMRAPDEIQAPHNYIQSEAAPQHILEPNASTPIYGKSRYVAQAFGRDKVFQEDSKPLQETLAVLAKKPGFPVEQFERTVTHLGKLKANADQDKAVYENFARKLFEQYKGSEKKLLKYGVEITKKSEPVYPKDVDQAIANHRSGLPTEPGKDSKDSLSSILAESFGTEDKDYRLFTEQLSGDELTDFKRLLQLKYNAEGNAKRGIEGSAQAYKAASEEALPIIRDAHNVVKEITGDPLARLHVRSVTRHPMGRQHGMLDFSVDYVNAHTSSKLTAEAKANYTAFASAARAAVKDVKYKTKYTVNAKNATLAAGAGLLSLDQSAQAADGQEHKSNRTASNIGMALIGAVAVHRFGPTAVNAFLKSPKLFQAASLFKDSLDHMDYLDALLNRTGKGIVKEVLSHQAAAMQASFGVSFGNQSEKALAYDLLRQKEISPVEALTGKAGTVFERLNPEQRKAVVEYHLNRQTLAAKLSAFKKEVADFAIANPLKNDGLLKEAASVLDHMHKALKPREVAHDDLDRLLQHSLSNAMDYFFFLNPAHHMLNLTDQVISGASRVGAISIFNANRLLATDKDIAKAFQHSNIVGSFRAEGEAQGALARKTFQLPDFASDKINADRVTLASFLDYYNRNPQKMQALGYKSSTQFAKSVLAGNADPTITADSWSHVAEVTNRTLGVDPFRVNSDRISRMASAPAFGVFVKQPARIARLAVHNIADKNFGGLYNMLAFTALVGGRAAIPTEIRSLWSTFDPDGVFQAEKDLDRINVVRNLTGNDTAGKLEMSIVYPAQAALSPGYQAIKDIPEAAGDFYAVAHELYGHEDWQSVAADPKALHAAERLFSLISSVALPRVAGLPTRQILQAAKTAEMVHDNKLNVSYYVNGKDRPMHMKDSFDMSEFGISPYQAAASKFLPGTGAFESALLQAEKEKAARKLAGQTVSPDQQIYSRPSILINKRKGRDILQDITPRD